MVNQDFKKYCIEYVKDSLKLCKSISSSDPPVQFNDLYPKFIHGKFDDIEEENTINYTEFIVKFQDKITKLDSSTIVNMIVSEQPTVKQYLTKKIKSDKKIESIDFAPYTINWTLDFLIEYLESKKNFEFDIGIFSKVFDKFRNFIEQEINYSFYFCPLYNFVSNIKEATFHDGLKISQITKQQFKIISNLGRGEGQHSDVPGDLLSLTHVISFVLPQSDNFFTDNKKVEEVFAKFLQSLKLFTNGDVQTGALYRNYNSVWKRRTSAIIFNETHIDSGNNLKLNKSQIESFRKFYQNFTKINLDGNDLRFLKIAIRRFSLASEKLDDEDKIVDFVISLESLLLSGPGEGTVKISNRVAILNGKSDKDREFVWKFMKEAYNFRSGIVHGDDRRQFTVNEKTYVMNDIIIKLEQISRDCIKKSLNLIPHYKKQKALIDEIDLSLLNRIHLDQLNKNLVGDF